MRRISVPWRGVPAIVVLGCALIAGAGCNRTAGAVGQGPGAAPPGTPPVVVDSPAPNPPAGSPAPPKSAPPKSAPPPAQTWPSPEDCVSYNPNNLTVHYEAGIHAINDGTKTVARVPGGPGENVGSKALAVAKRYKKHCYLGRHNTREDHNSYVFDYWREGSGLTTTIADQDEDCSGYNRGNLTVEDMGSGHGWRVKDHDHVLHLFDTKSDADNGKLVLVKYSRICFLGNSSDDDPDLLSYSL